MTELIILGIAGVVALIIYLIAWLHQQYRDYQTLFESVPCTISIQDRQFRIIGYNREFSQTFDIAQGKYCYAVYKGRDTACEVCPVAETFLDGKSHYSEETRVNKDGSRKFWIVKTAPLRNANGEIYAAVEMCLDVSHRKELEEELAKSEQKYYAIFNTIPNPVFVLDPNSHIILDCNDKVTSVYGFDLSDVINKSFIDFFEEQDAPHYAFILNKRSEIGQVRHRAKDNRIIYVNIRISPSEFLGQNVLLITISDITQRLEAEQQLSQAGKMATLGEMATGVAHELNQPLTVIKMASNYFIKKMRSGEVISNDIFVNMCEKIQKNVERADRIINHMRDFARKSDITLEKVEINGILRSAHDIFSQQLKLRNIEVVWDLTENLPLIQADAGRLEQVFINLLINARDAIEEKWRDAPVQKSDKRIILKTGWTPKSVFAQVMDTGCGVPNAIRDKIFEPFFTTKEVGKGTGLGLSISYGFVKDFRGDIRIMDRPEGGACFHVEFPACEWEDDIQQDPIILTEVWP